MTTQFPIDRHEELRPNVLPPLPIPVPQRFMFRANKPQTLSPWHFGLCSSLRLSEATWSAAALDDPIESIRVEIYLLFFNGLLLDGRFAQQMTMESFNAKKSTLAVDTIRRTVERSYGRDSFGDFAWIDDDYEWEPLTTTCCHQDFDTVGFRDHLYNVHRFQQ